MIRSKAKTKVIDKGFKNAMDEIKEISRGPIVKIGVQSEEGSQKEPGDSLNLAQIASVNEFGSSDGRIPSRPFVRSTMDENRRLIEQRSDQLSFASLRGTISARRMLEILGLFIESLMKRKLTRGPWEPNAPSTVLRKGSSRPLIDTGRLRSSIRYKVEMGGGE